MNWEESLNEFLEGQTENKRQLAQATFEDPPQTTDAEVTNAAKQILAALLSDSQLDVNKIQRAKAQLTKVVEASISPLTKALQLGSAEINQQCTAAKNHLRLSINDEADWEQIASEIEDRVIGALNSNRDQLRGQYNGMLNNARQVATIEIEKASHKEIEQWMREHTKHVLQTYHNSEFSRYQGLFNKLKEDDSREEDPLMNLAQQECSQCPVELYSKDQDTIASAVEAMTRKIIEGLDSESRELQNQRDISMQSENDKFAKTDADAKTICKELGMSANELGRISLFSNELSQSLENTNGELENFLYRLSSDLHGRVYAKVNGIIQDKKNAQHTEFLQWLAANPPQSNILQDPQSQFVIPTGSAQQSHLMQGFTGLENPSNPPFIAGPFQQPAVAVPRGVVQFQGDQALIPVEELWRQGAILPTGSGSIYASVPNYSQSAQSSNDASLDPSMNRYAMSFDDTSPANAGTFSYPSTVYNVAQSGFQHSQSDGSHSFPLPGFQSSMDMEIQSSPVDGSQFITQQVFESPADIRMRPTPHLMGQTESFDNLPFALPPAAASFDSQNVLTSVEDQSLIDPMQSSSASAPLSQSRASYGASGIIQRPSIEQRTESQPSSEPSNTLMQPPPVPDQSQSTRSYSTPVTDQRRPVLAQPQRLPRSSRKRSRPQDQQLPQSEGSQSSTGSQSQNVAPQSVPVPNPLLIKQNEWQIRNRLAREIIKSMEAKLLPDILSYVVIYDVPDDKQAQVQNAVWKELVSPLVDTKANEMADQRKPAISMHLPANADIQFLSGQQVNPAADQEGVKYSQEEIDQATNTLLTTIDQQQLKNLIQQKNQETISQNPPQQQEEPSERLTQALRIVERKIVPRDVALALDVQVYAQINSLFLQGLIDAISPSRYASLRRAISNWLRPTVFKSAVDEVIKRTNAANDRSVDKEIVDSTPDNVSIERLAIKLANKRKEQFPSSLIQSVVKEKFDEANKHQGIDREIAKNSHTISGLALAPQCLAFNYLLDKEKSLMADPSTDTDLKREIRQRIQANLPADIQSIAFSDPVTKYIIAPAELRLGEIFLPGLLKEHDAAWANKPIKQIFHPVCQELDLNGVVSNVVADQTEEAKKRGVLATQQARQILPTPVPSQPTASNEPLTKAERSFQQGPILGDRILKEIHILLANHVDQILNSAAEGEQPVQISEQRREFIKHSVLTNAPLTTFLRTAAIHPIKNQISGELKTYFSAVNIHFKDYAEAANELIAQVKNKHSNLIPDAFKAAVISEAGKKEIDKVINAARTQPMIAPRPLQEQQPEQDQMAERGTPNKRARRGRGSRKRGGGSGGVA